MYNNIHEHTTAPASAANLGGGGSRSIDPQENLRILCAEMPSACTCISIVKRAVLLVLYNKLLPWHTVEPFLSGPLTCGHIPLLGNSPILTWRSLPTKIGKGRHTLILPHYYMQLWANHSNDHPLLLFHPNKEGSTVDAYHRAEKVGGGGHAPSGPTVLTWLYTCTPMMCINQTMSQSQKFCRQDCPLH